MKSYDPSRAPDPAEWLDLDESEQNALVERFHIESGEESNEESGMLHAAIHVIIENQVALETRPVPETIEKLMRQGLDRHEAIHAVGAVLSEDLFEMMQGNKASFDPKTYRRRLEKLTAKRWRKGQW